MLTPINAPVPIGREAISLLFRGAAVSGGAD
jgi:hypothetical protein